jgi:uncharacterized protein DUF6687
MRFEYYHAGLDKVPKLSVDGTVANAIHFSHWQGNETPASVKADTSTEIALNLVSAPDREELTGGIELITNNHFDTDGVLSVWTVLTGAPALELRSELIAAAEAGDFSEFTGENAVRASIVIQGSESPIEEDSGSPLANYLAGKVIDDDALAYELVLPKVAHVLAHPDQYEPLWRTGWERIAAALESFAKGASTSTEDPEGNVSLITLAPEVFSAAGFNPTSHAAPYTAISRYARGRLFVIARPVSGGWSYRIDYPYYSWAETRVRPPIARRDFTALVSRLNELEKPAAASWKLDSGELASAIKFSQSDGTLGASSLEPDTVASEVRAASSSSALVNTALNVHA